MSVIAVGAGFPIAPRPNLIKDGAYLTRSTANWTADTGHVTFRNDTVHGTVLRITCTDASLRYIRQYCTVPAGSRVRFWARGDGILKARFYLYSVVLGVYDSWYSDVGGAWTYFDFTTTQGPGEHIYFRTYGVEAPNTWIEFAGLTITEPAQDIVQPANLIKDGAHLTRSLSHWSITGVPSFQNSELGPTLKITCDGTSTRRTAQHIAVPIGTRVRCWARGDGVVQCQVYLWDAVHGNRSELSDAGGAWTYFDFVTTGGPYSTIQWRTYGVEAVNRWIEVGPIVVTPN